jgi:ABC-type nitrate/sulfonate/bicarbonate transport system permease component
VLLWQLAALSGATPEYLPGPLEILKNFFVALGSAELYQHAGASLGRALPGFALGSLAGVAFGLAAGVSRGFDDAFSPLVFLSYPVPKIVLLPLFMLWFGIGETSKILIIALACFYPVFINAYYGARSTQKILVWSALGMGASRAEVFRRIVVPSAAPQIFAGLRVSLALAFIVMFAAEMINARSGLGYLIKLAENNLRFDLMYVSLFSIAILGFAGDRLLTAVREKALAWQVR